MYTFAQTGEQRYAQLHFQSERLTQVLGFTSESELGAPREITPEQGDTFTIYDRWMDVNAEGQATNIVKQPGTTLTFGAEPFTWVQLYAAKGLRDRVHRDDWMGTSIPRTQVVVASPLIPNPPKGGEGVIKDGWWTPSIAAA
jgi:hypothetical protein